MAGRYPSTVAAFSSMPGGESALRAVMELERRWVALGKGGSKPEPFNFVKDENALPQCPPEAWYDVVIAGGGLGLVAAAALARRGLKVLVFDRQRVGEAHREWNISERELNALVQHGIFTQDEVGKTVGTRYARGLISFDATGTGVPACSLQLQGVLDVALNAQAVLDMARAKFLQAGGTILEGRAFRKLHVAKSGHVASVFEVEGPHGIELYRARLAIDTMGSVSPIAVGLNGGLPFDGVCPTAGTVVEGLDADHTTGDVLVSVAPASEGRQLIWEGFPGRGKETTVYLFYYDRTGAKEAEGQSLLWLFERYFNLLPTYRKPAGSGQYRHLRPVFGYIPARYGRSGRTAARGLLCLGDSAAGQSPLTFCGFGSFVRHIGRVAGLINFAFKHDLLEESHLREISPHQANLRVAWVFSRFMQPWRGSDPSATNRLMNIFCRALGDVGQETTVRFLHDRYTLGEYLKIMLTTAKHYPGVFALTARVLGPHGLLKWAGDLSAFALDDSARRLHKLVGGKRWKRLEQFAARVSPAIALKLVAKRSGWRVVEDGR
jgi:lycopene cyclase CruA